MEKGSGVTRVSGSLEHLGITVMAAGMALAVATWAYGVYCYVQMVRHRRAGVPMFSIAWPAAYLTERGRTFRRRALLSYAAFAILALFLVLWGRFIASRVELEPGKPPGMTESLPARA